MKLGNPHDLGSLQNKIINPPKWSREYKIIMQNYMMWLHGQNMGCQEMDKWIQMG